MTESSTDNSAEIFCKNIRNGFEWSKYTYAWVIGYLDRYFFRLMFDVLRKSQNLNLKNLFNDSKLFEIFHNCIYVSLRMLENVILLIWHNLENMEFWRITMKLAMNTLWLIQKYFRPFLKFLKKFHGRLRNAVISRIRKTVSEGSYWSDHHSHSKCLSCFSILT